MGATSFLNLLLGNKTSCNLELVTDNHKGHQSDYAPSTLRRKRSSSPSSSLHSKKKSQLCRWDSTPNKADKNVKTASSSSSSNNNNRLHFKPLKQPVRMATSDDASPPPSLKRMMLSSPLPRCTLRNVLKPVRRSSFDFSTSNNKNNNTTTSSSSTKQANFDSIICGDSVGMSTVDLLSAVLNNLELLDDDDDDDASSLDF